MNEINLKKKQLIKKKKAKRKKPTGRKKTNEEKEKKIWINGGKPLNLGSMSWKPDN